MNQPKRAFLTAPSMASPSISSHKGRERLSLQSQIGHGSFCVDKQFHTDLKTITDVFINNDYYNDIFTG